MNAKIGRAATYAVGLVVLALGLVLNTKTGLGAAPLVSVAYCASQLTGLSFANASFIGYGVFALIEVAIHLAKGQKKRLVNDVLQLPFALVFTRFMGLFDRVIAPLPGDAPLISRLPLLAVAILLIGTGACLSVRMRLIPNPGDGVVLAISDATGWKLGVTKNAFDLTNVAIACAVGLIVLTSQSLGSDRTDDLRETVHTSIVSSAFSSACSLHRSAAAMRISPSVRFASCRSASLAEMFQ